MVEVINVAKTYLTGENRVEALRGVTFQVPQGSCAFIVGPSGSGKSTLLTLLGALDRPTSGQVLIGNRDLAAMTENEQDEFRHDQVGFVFQAFNLIGNLSALDNVLIPILPGTNWAEWREKAIQLLGDVGLGNRLKHRPAQLSGGQQQRVAIARALVKDPLLILADEPTGELDSRAGDEIFQILRHHQQERGCTLIVVTHDRRYIRAGDLLFELEDGLLVNGQAAREPAPVRG